MAIAHAILVSLVDCPASGYDLAKQFEASVGFFWRATHQQIYRELTKLEEQGWISAEVISQENRPDKKLYSVTDLGKQQLIEWINENETNYCFRQHQHGFGNQNASVAIAGETLQGYEFFTAAGGKGANQAVAAARLGISTQMVGRLGNDDFGHQLLSSLQAAGVHTDGVLVDEAASSGVAVIAVDDAGENNIIIVAGANGRVNQQDVERLTDLLPGCRCVAITVRDSLTCGSSSGSGSTKGWGTSNSRPSTC
jgi:DNA-binding PadR family transcriptional regulator